MLKHPLVRGSWILKHLFALTIFVTLIGFGFWQLDRLEQRRAFNAARLAVLDQNPMTLTPQSDPEALFGRRVRLTGTFRNDESVVLRGRASDSGVAGVHLLVPLQLSGSDRAVLVDRGWLPDEQRDPERRAAYAVSREVTIEGLALPPQTRSDALLAPIDVPLAGETRIDAWIRADVAKIQEQVAVPLLPVYVEQLPEAGSTALPRPADPRLLDEGPHLSYALQWFAFAGMLAIVYAGLMRQELQKAAG
ncbi:MAG: SURF1 family protein [Oscillochloris sp.]|nr:SURF1 family protein [Oscillochloris sp.]